MEPHDTDGTSDGAPVEATAEPGAATPEPAAATSAAPPKNEHVAAALRELDEIADRPLAEHPDAFGRVHTGLQQALADIDDA